ncbi:MAG: substrate-binding domain-containing protein [Planctomycetota bacterium]|jgi:ABC-type sugar transport system substrate-binding protein
MTCLLRQAGHATLSLILLTGWIACRPESSQQRREATASIAVVGAGETDPLWPVLQTAAAKFQGRTGGANVRVAAPRSVSANLQGQLIRRLYEEGTRGLCVQVIDPIASAKLLESLRARGAVVVTMMRSVESQDPFLHCGIDPADMGTALAQAVAEQVPQGGTIGVLYADSDAVYRLRRGGFNRQFVRYPRLTMLRELDCRGDAALAVKMMREAMERFPGIDGWVAMDSWSLQLPDDGRPLLPSGCALVLPGPLADPVSAIRSGRCQALVIAKDYQEIVTQALEMCLLVLDQQMVHRRFFEVPTRCVTLQTLTGFEEDWASWTGADAKPQAPASDTP